MKRCNLLLCGFLVVYPIFGSAQQRYASPSSRVELRSGSMSSTASSAAPPNVAPLPFSTPAKQSPLTTTTTSASVELGPGDLLEIAVLDTPEVSGRFRVNASGEITMPLIGTVPVKGSSPERAQALIASKLMQGDFIKDPQVTVFVSEYASQMVYVVGEIQKPGAYPLMGSHRVMDFISAAGGLTPRAAESAKLTPHNDPAHPVRLVLGAEDPAENLELHPGDSLMVEQTGLVYVLGDVNRPGGFAMDRHARLTLLRALALAEGTSPTASSHKTMLIRTGPSGRTQEELDLKKMVKGEVADMPLQEGDIVYVPSRRAAKRTLDALLQGTTTAAIYAGRP